MISYRTHHPINLRSGPPRTSGIHLSSLVRAAALAGHHIDSSYEEDDLDILIATTDPLAIGSDGRLTRILTGLMWESCIFRQLSSSDDTFIPHPGELTWDNIIGTPDGYRMLPDGRIIICEMKSTFKSSRKDLINDIPWMWQVAGYLYMASKQFGEHCLLAEFHPLYIRGDYRGIDPQYLPTMVAFEWEELVGIWNLLGKYKDKVIPEVHD